jgi:hypothetical protein
MQRPSCEDHQSKQRGNAKASYGKERSCGVEWQEMHHDDVDIPCSSTVDVKRWEREMEACVCVCVCVQDSSLVALTRKISCCRFTE